jgi:peptide/nickel transport system substrate-binding protein
MLKRRTLLQAAGMAALAAPSIAAAQNARVLKFVPQADLAVVDPIWTTAEVTRNHGLMVYDTLFGVDADFRPLPQMADAARIEDNERKWTLFLRSGLLFHDGTPVLARDVVASLRRWGRKDSFGQVLMSVTDEISAPDDRTVGFRLKRPFPLLATALGKPNSNIAAIMPERLAQTDPATQVKEVIGSGPYRFKADERVPGSLAVYERFEKYEPRTDPRVEWTSGPKVANFDRIEWHTLPDPATAAAALMNGEVDWWEWPNADLLPMLRTNANLRVAVNDPTGNIAIMRMNHLWPPFDNPAIRRAMFGAVNQEEFMLAVAGTDRSIWHTGVGFFCPDSLLASNVGMQALTGKRSLPAVRSALADAGYKGERVVLLGANDLAVVKAECDVGADMMKQAGMNVDYQARDWATVVQRRAIKEPPEKGGWNVFFTGTRGLDQMSPATHIALRGNGMDAWPGWPNAPKLEELRQAWFDAAELEEQQKIGQEMQFQAFIDVPYIPLGFYMTPTAFRKELTGFVQGVPVFWNVRRR